MNRRNYFTGIALALMAAVSIWAVARTTPTAVAGNAQARVGDERVGADESATSRKAIADAGSASDDHDREDSTGAGDDEEGEEEFCREHGIPEDEDALCRGDFIAQLRPGTGMKVRLASPEVADKAGIGVARPRRMSLAAGIDVPGRVEFNRNRLAHITPLSAGVVQGVRVRPGTEVAQGELLAEIAMPEIASLKARFLAAIAREKQTEATYQREKDLLERGITSQREFQQADAEYHAAQSASEQFRQQLQNFGLTPENIQQFLHDGTSSAVLPLRAPFGGTVVEVETAVGEAVEPGTALFTVADLDSLWIELSVPESRIYLARVDAPIEARFNGLPGMVFVGRVFQAGAVVDEKTRTLKVLAEVKNPNHRLRAGMYGDARMLEGKTQQVLVVPADALQDIDGAPYVFVQQERDLFELRRVRAGARKDGEAVVLAGLSRDEQVVVSQGFSLKSEVLKARLGASCVDE